MNRRVYAAGSSLLLRMLRPRWAVVLLSLASITLLDGCAGYLPASGPSRGNVQDAALKQADSSLVQVVDLNDSLARRLMLDRHQALFSDTFASTSASSYTVGPGDTLAVSIWEAPPAALFGSIPTDMRATSPSTQLTNLPEQMVGSDGAITVPFAGDVPVAGKQPQEIEADIVRRLKGKANQPQVMVRVVHNVTANVTVVGEVATSARVPLTARGERLLDALAAAGGVRQAVNKMTIQLTRGAQVAMLPLQTIIQDPRQNITLLPGDVVTAMFDPLSLTVMGATAQNQEINFETQGISLAQALSRAGGLQDSRADPRGVFIFRFEDPALVDQHGRHLPTTPDGKIPVIYEVDLRDPAAFFVAQNFRMENKDLLYVSNAPAAELQKFLNVVTSVVYTIVNVPTITGH